MIRVHACTTQRKLYAQTFLTQEKRLCENFPIYGTTPVAELRELVLLLGAHMHSVTVPKTWE